MSNISKITGSSLIVAGTAIGAAMLAMPIASFSIGFFSSIILLIFMYCLSTYTALVALEVNMAFGTALSIPRIAAKHSKVIGWFATCVLAILFYSLLAAYISGIAEITKTSIKSYYDIEVSQVLLKFIFTLLIFFLVSSYTKIVDLGNRFFFFLKIIVFISMIVIFLPKINVGNFDFQYQKSFNFSVSSLFVTIPIFFTAFGFHGSIPVIIKYLDGNPKDSYYTFIIGSFVSLIVYFIWQSVVFGVLPEEGELSFRLIQESDNTLGMFVQVLSKLAQKPIFEYITSIFSWLAIVTSLIGVGIGLFDFFIEREARHTGFINRIKAGVFTFFPPFIISLRGKEIFIKALSFAAISLSILAIILPVVFAFKLRRSKKSITYRYKAPGGDIALILAFFAGCVIIVSELITLF